VTLFFNEQRNKVAIGLSSPFWSFTTCLGLSIKHKQLVIWSGGFAAISGNVQNAPKFIARFFVDEVVDDQQRSVLFESLSSRGQMQVAQFTKGEIQGFNQMICPLCVLACQAGAHP
jgi:hypothetical protein